MGSFADEKNQESRLEAMLESWSMRVPPGHAVEWKGTDGITAPCGFVLMAKQKVMTPCEPSNLRH